MKLTPRPYRDEEDYWRIRAFLRQVMLLNEPARAELARRPARLVAVARHRELPGLRCGAIEQMTFL